MRKGCLLGIAIGTLIVGTAGAGTAVPLADANRILPSSIDLERRVEPWCPGDCAVSVPFVASYRRGQERLVFVGAHHAFEPAAPTMRAVAKGFTLIQARVVIVEGFPTAMGESPKPIVEAARRYGTPGVDEYSRGEPIYAASLALKRSIPFLGGEPTRLEEIQVLKARGFTDVERAFNAMTGLYSQALRSRDMPDMSLESLRKRYPQVVATLKLPLDQGGMRLDALSLDEFQRRYKELYGTDIVDDAQFPLRVDVVNDHTRNGQQTRADMLTRDGHLLGLIEQQLEERHSVLVVYGGSHWATLSAALQKRLGTPIITPFLN